MVRKYKEGKWITKDYKELDIRDMETSHIKNTINFLNKHEDFYDEYYCLGYALDNDYQEYDYEDNSDLVYKKIEELNNELERRKNMIKEENVKISEIIKLFKEESCNNVIDYEFFKTKCPDNTCFYDLVIYYYTNLYSIEHKEPNELDIVLDNDLRIMGVEFESQGDRMSRTPAWKRLCKAVANDETFVIDIKERKINFVHFVDVN